MDVIKIIFTGQNLIMVGASLTILYNCYRKIIKMMDSRQDSMILQVQKMVDDNTKEVLRLQLLTGIDSGRLSISEVGYFYDKYRKLGGNSFISIKVETYIKTLEEENKL